MNFDDLINYVGDNISAMNAITKGYRLIEICSSGVCSVSGGSDSDIMLDLVHKLDADHKIHYVFFDTGIEYEATKRHLNYLEQKYNITITRKKAKIPVPLACKNTGVPFWSKYVSEMISRLQYHGFKWEDKSFNELLLKYPKCKSALKWWCNEWGPMKNGDDSTYNIRHIKGLKEFIITCPPTFKVSNKCCTYAKKRLGHDYYNEIDADLNIVGVRKAEGGARVTRYKTCFSNTSRGDEWRPLFWFSNEDKRDYKEHCKITYSDCYEVYGLKRTGCAGCPFGKRFEFELEVLKEYEPKLYKAVCNIFGDSYDYTRRFLKFRKELKEVSL